MLCRFLLATLLVTPVAIAAQEVDEAMKRAEQRSDEMRAHTVEVFKQAEELSTSSEFLEGLKREGAKALQEADSAPKQALPHWPEPSADLLDRARNDIDRLLNQAQGQPHPSPMDERHGPQLYVFVSFSLPEITLKRLLTQARRIDASLILRGLVDDDLGKTKAKITQLLEADAQGNTQIKGGFAIDPTLFERFDITQAPSFVLTDAPAARCTESDCASIDHVRLSGDIPIDYALETMAREAPAMKASAEQLLARMKGGTSP